MIRKKAMASTLGLIKEDMRVHGKMGNSMVKEYLCKVIFREKAFGKTAREPNGLIDKVREI